MYTMKHIYNVRCDLYFICIIKYKLLYKNLFLFYIKGLWEESISVPVGSRIYQGFSCLCWFDPCSSDHNDNFK